MTSQASDFPSPEDMQRETEYRVTERLGILAEDRPASLSQYFLADQEVLEWEKSIQSIIHEP